MLAIMSARLVVVALAGCKRSPSGPPAMAIVTGRVLGERGEPLPAAAVIGIAGELVKGTTSSGTVRRHDPKLPLNDAELERIVTQVQGEALDDAERRIAWESGVERLDVRLVHAAIVEIKIDGPNPDGVGEILARASTAGMPTSRWISSDAPSGWTPNMLSVRPSNRPAPSR